MGFATSAIAAGTQLLGTATSAYAQRQEGKTARMIGERNASYLESQARIKREESHNNAGRMRKNARLETGRARLDAGASNLVGDGSVAVRDIALAERLETQIRDTMKESLSAADDLNTQAAMSRWEGKVKDKAGKMAATGTVLSGIGGMARSFLR